MVPSNVTNTDFINKICVGNILGPLQAIKAVHKYSILRSVLLRIHSKILRMGMELEKLPFWCICDHKNRFTRRMTKPVVFRD